MVGFFVACTVVALMQWVRLRRAVLLPLVALFALLALGHAQESQDGWWRFSHGAAGLAALWELAILSRRREGDSSQGAGGQGG